MKRISSAIFSIALLLLVGLPALAQENETKVVDEVVAQVNEGVLTLSRIRREMKFIIDTYVQEGKSREEAQKLVNEKQPELIANLINEELILQKAKELGLDAEIEASLNQRFLQIMKEQNIKSLDALYQEMEKTGLNPDEVREGWRKQAAREAVVRKEVQSKVYWEASSKELKDYYEKNKDKFTQPETVTLSEIFLGFAGRNEATVREKAKTLHTQLKGGADFIKLATDNSDHKVEAQTVSVKDLDDKYAKVIKELKPGEFTDPVEIDQVGVNILRVDKRTLASSDSVFDENAVRFALMQEKYPDSLKSFMARLREDSYIKLSESYRSLVAPLLFADERSKDKPVAPKAKPTEK
jgi:peptidyl-prolyl cis-trans isomerase SurA